MLARLPTRVEREPVVGEGLGGDDTTAIDRAAEEVILARVREAAGAIVSEEVGRVGGIGLPLVVVDPIDGSLNAKRGIPFFSLSIAVAGGETMDDVVFGFVHDFGSREEWTARRGEGAWLDGEPLALSLCHLAAGRVDAVCSLKPARSVDIAAGQLLCRELGLAVDLFDVEEPFGAAPLDLERRSRVVAAGSAAVCDRIASALPGDA